MKLTFNTTMNLLEALRELATEKLPFKLSMILAKNIAALEKEEEFFINQEREFALKYLAMENGQFVSEREGVFKINEGMEEECREAREALNTFEVDADIRMIPVSLIENMEFAPKTLMALENILDEEA